MNLIPSCVTIDFETAAIQRRPDYPPIPAGVAIEVPGERPKYMAWGHPSHNNCNRAQAYAELARWWNIAGKLPLLFHHSKFDYDVGVTHLGLPELDWRQIHDTLFLIFLQNPDRHTLSLKPVAEEALGLKPIERDAVREWLVEHKIVAKNDKRWGAHMAKAPGNLVGRYAIGDVTRTRKLFQRYYREVVITRGMSVPYDRERQLMPILLESERQGVRVDVPLLERDVPRYKQGLESIDEWIRRRLHAPKDFNADSDEELAEAILRAKKADLTKWERTEKTGQYSTSKTALDAALTDRPLQAALAYRGPLATCVRTFMGPWLDVAQQSGGLIFTSWNQVAQDYHESGAKKGARTGRLSSVPNFQNIVTDLTEKEALQRALLVMSKLQKLREQLKRFPLPMVRGYVVPLFKGWVLNDRDFSQQELRILAHFEDGVLLQAYMDDPWLDMHSFVMQVVNEILHANFPRKPIKNLNFGIIYGQGMGKTAMTMDVDVSTARRIQNAHRRGFPGIPALIRELKDRAAQGLPIRTWGGREYFCEPPAIAKKGPRKGQRITFEYKLINTLIQGSAADNTKQAMINYAARRKTGKLLLNVHDELLTSCPAGDRVREMRALRDAMGDCKFDVPMLSTGAWSKTRWTEMKDLPKGE